MSKLSEAKPHDLERRLRAIARGKRLYEAEERRIRAELARRARG